MRSVVCALTDLPCDDAVISARTRRVRARLRESRPTLLNRFVRRLLLGLPTVGAGSLINMLWSLPFPITHWLRLRLRRNNRNGSDLIILIFLGIILIGAVRYVLCFPTVTVSHTSQSFGEGIPTHGEDSAQGACPG